MAVPMEGYSQISGKAVHGIEADTFACNRCGVVVYNQDLHNQKAHSEEIAVETPTTPSETHEVLVVTPDG